MNEIQDEPARNVGHGHVFPRPDGVRARCGGPPICRVCAVDYVRKHGQNPSGGKVEAVGAVLNPPPETITFQEWSNQADVLIAELELASRRGQSADSPREALRAHLRRRLQP